MAIVGGVSKRSNTINYAKLIDVVWRLAVVYVCMGCTKIPNVMCDNHDSPRFKYAKTKLGVVHLLWYASTLAVWYFSLIIQINANLILLLKAPKLMSNASYEQAIERTNALCGIYRCVHRHQTFAYSNRIPDEIKIAFQLAWIDALCETRKNFKGQSQCKLKI